MRYALSAVLFAAAALADEPAAPAPTPAPSIVGRSQLGGAGLQRVRSAEVVPRSLGVGADVGFFRVNSLTQGGGADEYHLTTYGAYFSPLNLFEISVTARSATLQQQASPRIYYFLVNDLFLRGRVGYPLTKGLWVGVELGLRIPPPAFISQPFYKGMSPIGTALVTYDFKGMGFPLVFHLNTGFTIDNSVEFDDLSGDTSRAFALGITTYNRWTTAVALEGRFDINGFGLRPFLEYEADVALGAQGAIPMRLIPGLRVLPWRGSYVDLAVEVGLTRPNAHGVLPVAPWQLMLGLGYQLDFSSGPAAAPTERIVERVVEKEKRVETTAPPTKGTVKGTVTDAATGAVLKDAIVTLPGRNRLLTSAKGTYQVPDIEPGALEVWVTATGYAEASSSGKIAAGKVTAIDVKLAPLPPEPPPPVKVRGTIMSEKDKPVAATVSAAAAGVSTKAGANGEYEITVPEGDQGIEVGAPGFLTQGRRIVTKAGDSVVLDFVLKEVPKQTLVVLTKEKIEIKKQVHFATDKDVILPDSAPLLDEVASLILSNDKLRAIRIEGHTDSVGDDAHNLDLSQRRAQSVMRALLERGIEVKRLKAVGYGESKPIGDNKTAKGKAANRRVEFMIEEQD